MINNKKRFAYHCASAGERVALYYLLPKLGYVTNPPPDLYGGYQEYPMLVVDGDNRGFGFYTLVARIHAEYEKLSLSEFLQRVTGVEEPIQVKLNNTYDALVTKRSITVGCQEISFAAFAALADAVKTKREEK